MCLRWCRAPRDAPPQQVNERTQSFHSLYMTSMKHDALHPDNLPRSFVRPVMWQNPTASMRQGVKEALQQLADEEREKARHQGALRLGPGGVPRPPLPLRQASSGGERLGWLILGSRGSKGSRGSRGSNQRDSAEAPVPRAGSAGNVSAPQSANGAV
jgi:hypothetical protein